MFVANACAGAAFERPAEKYPRVFGAQFFRDYPYAMPSFVIAAFTLSGAIVVALFVNEVCSGSNRRSVTANRLTDIARR